MESSPQRPSPRSPQRRMSLVSVVVSLVVVALAPATALAGNADEAKAHVARASKAHKEGRYEDARVELEAAYALAPRPELLYALGQVYSKLGRCSEATAHYQRYVATQKDPQVRTVVDQAIAACKPAPNAAPAAPAPAAPAPAPAPTAAPAPTPPAPTSPAPAPALATESAAASPAAERPPAASPQPAPAADRPASRPASHPAPIARAHRVFAPTRAEPAPAAARSPWYKDKLGDGLVLGGVVAAAVGLVEYRSALADLDTAEDRTRTTTVARYRDLIDSAHGKRTASIVLLGAGGALITGGILRYALHDRSTEVSGVGVAPARGGGVVTYAGSF